MGEPAFQIDDEEDLRPIAPQSGPQTMFAECEADIAFYGGTAGSGKSVALLYEPAKWTVTPGVRGFRGVLFRRTSPELLGGGGLWDESQWMYRAFGGRPRGAPALDWTFEAETNRIGDRHRIEFRHLVHESTIYEHQGRQYAFIGFDEVTHFTSKQFWYLVSRLRSTCGVRPYVRGTCNPDPDSFVFHELVWWWIGDDGYPILERSGVVRWFVRDPERDSLVWFDSYEEARAAYPTCKVRTPDRKLVPFADEASARAEFPDAVHAFRSTRRTRGAPRLEFDAEPMSFTFIAARLADNQILLETDPTYRTKLMSLGRVDRMRLLGDPERGGNWLVRDAAGTFFAREKFKLLDKPPSSIVRRVRFWDKAYTKPTPKHPDPDWTRGVRLNLCEGGELYVDDVQSLRDDPAGVFALMRDVAESDGVETTIGTWEEPGFAGKSDSATVAAVLNGFVVEFVRNAADISAEGFVGTRSSRSQRAYARAWVPHLESGRVHVKRADWTEEFLSEHHQFPEGRHDDFVAGTSGAMQVIGQEQGTSLVEAMKGASG